jgi:ABC-type phosphate transport system substrate-binding protein
MMTMSRVLAVAAALVLAVGLLPGAADTGFRVIANPGVPVAALPAAQVSAMFLKKTTKWSDGTLVVPVDQVMGASAREDFSRAVHHKAASAIHAYWQKQIFAGIDLPPLAKESDAEVLDFVRATPGAIGYVRSGADASGVKVIAVR